MTFTDTSEAARADLLEAWRTNDRINLFLIDHISPEGMRATLSTRGGRDVARQLGHVHTNRVFQLEGRAKDLAKDLVKIQGKKSPTKAELRKAFKASGVALERFLGDVLAGVPKRRGFRKGIFTTFGYLIAHESHHRGNILVTLKACGHNPEKAVRDAIWGWDQM